MKKGFYNLVAWLEQKLFLTVDMVETYAEVLIKIIARSILSNFSPYVYQLFVNIFSIRYL